MANNQLLASDNFASGSLASGWSAFTILGYTAMQVVSGSPNVTEPSAVSANNLIYWSALTWPNDQTSEVTAQTLTTESGTYLTLAVRLQPSTGQGYFLIWTDGTASLSYYDGSMSHALTSASGTVAAGDVIALQAAGSCISLYQNGIRILYYGDATLTNGYPGYGQVSTVNITHTKVSSWRGYSLVQQDGVWTKQGVVFPANAADLQGYGAYEGNCLYDINPQILTQYTNVYKLWVSGGASGSQGTYYAESPDLVTWTRYPTSVLSGYVEGSIIKVNGTYYMYCQAQNAQGSGNIYLFTCTDGISWAQQSSNVLSKGTSLQWDGGDFYPLKPLTVINGTWYALYGACSVAGATGAAFKVGLVTSMDGAGLVWTKYSGNPVLPTASIPAGVYPFNCFAQVGGIYYLWFTQGPSSREMTTGSYYLDPNETFRVSTTDFINYTPMVKSIHHSQQNESVNTPTANSQPSDGSNALAIFTVGNQTKMIYFAGQGDSVGPQVFQVALATAPAPISELVQFNEDAIQQTQSDTFKSGVGNLDSNWTTLSGLTALKIVSGNLCEPSVTSGANCAAAFTGATFSTSQYSEITLSALTSNGVASPLVLANATNGSYYGVLISGPIGTQSFQAQISRSGTAFGPVVGITPEIGDVLRLSVIQTAVIEGGTAPVVSLFQNGFMVLQYVDESSSALTSGNPGILQSETAGAASQISLWAGGNANVFPPYSPPVPPTSPTSELLSPGQFLGASLSTAFSNPLGLDLIQVVNEGGQVVWNFTATGVTNVNPSNPTSSALIARYFGPSFASVFSPNPDSLDIFQVIARGGAVVIHVNYLGNVYTP